MMNTSFDGELSICMMRIADDEELRQPGTFNRHNEVIGSFFEWSTAFRAGKAVLPDMIHRI